MAKKKKKRRKRKSKKEQLFVVERKVKTYIKDKRMMSSGDFVSVLNKEVKAVIDKAIVRCKGNKRNTVQSKDI